MEWCKSNYVKEYPTKKYITEERGMEVIGKVV